jgi:hypothetical protein
VSYWVDISLGQGVLLRDPSLRHVKWMKWLRVKTQWEWGSLHTRGCSVSLMGAFVEGVWHLHLYSNFFQAHSFSILCFFKILGTS